MRLALRGPRRLHARGDLVVAKAAVEVVVVSVAAVKIVVVAARAAALAASAT